VGGAGPNGSADEAPIGQGAAVTTHRACLGMATVAEGPRPTSAQPGYFKAVVLPPLPEAQQVRPPTAAGRRSPEDDNARQVPDDYFTLPRIETATRMAEDQNPYQPPQAAVSTRVPGGKSAKAGEGIDSTQPKAGDVRSPQRQVGSLKDRGDAAGPDPGVSRSSALDGTLDGRVASDQGRGATASGAGETASAEPGMGARIDSVAQEKKAARRGPLPSQARKEKEKEGFAARLAGQTGPLPGGRKGEFSTVGKADATVGREREANGEVVVNEEGHGVGVPQAQILKSQHIVLLQRRYTRALSLDPFDRGHMPGHLLLRNVCRRRRQPKSAWSEYDRATCARTSARGAPGVTNSAKSSV